VDVEERNMAERYRIAPPPGAATAFFSWSSVGELVLVLFVVLMDSLPSVVVLMDSLPSVLVVPVVSQLLDSELLRIWTCFALKLANFDFTIAILLCVGLGVV
jgi:hypothetical protein